MSQVVSRPTWSGRPSTRMTVLRPSPATTRAWFLGGGAALALARLAVESGLASN
jgi:hypothetical protein